MSGRLCSITLSVWILKSRRIYLSLSWTDCGLRVYHLSLHCKWYFLHSNQHKQAPTLFLNLVITLSILTFTQAWTGTHSLQSGVSLDLSIYLMTLTGRAFPWAAHKRVSVSCLSFPRFMHSHLLSSSVLSVSLKNWLWIAFFYDLIRRCFLISCLFWTFINFLCFSSVFVLIKCFSFLLRLYSAKFSLL